MASNDINAVIPEMIKFQGIQVITINALYVYNVLKICCKLKNKINVSRNINIATSIYNTVMPVDQATWTPV